MDRRGFLRALVGGAAATALPFSLLLQPEAAKWTLANAIVRGDDGATYSSTLIGLPTNARFTALDSNGIRWPLVIQRVSVTKDFTMSFHLDQGSGR